MTTRIRADPIPFARGLRAGLVGGALAAILNLALYFAVRAASGESLAVLTPASPEPMAVAAVGVILLSLIPGVVAGLVYALISRFSANPQRWLLVLAALVLALMAVPPLSAAQSAVTLWTLQLMHLAAAGAILWAVLRYARP